jgi:segregation and condensation protein A
VAPPSAARPAGAVSLTGVPYEVTTPVFQGPLELMTQMVARDELDVFEICLAALVESFLKDAGGEHDLDLTTEFLVLSATLLELKTRSLLAVGDPPEEEDPEAPPDLDLVLARMLEGRTFRGAAAALASLIRSADRSVPRRAGPEEPMASASVDPLESVTSDQLRQALWRALAPRPVVDLYHVAPIRASVTEAIDRVVGALNRCQQLSFFDLTAEETDRLELIVRFLAVLELYKQGLVDLEQAAAFGELLVRAREAVDDDLLEDVLGQVEDELLEAGDPE